MDPGSTDSSRAPPALSSIWAYLRPAGDSVRCRSATSDSAGGARLELTFAKPVQATEIRVYEPGNTPEWGTHAMGATQRQMTHGTVAKITPTATGRELASNNSFYLASRRCLRSLFISF